MKNSMNLFISDELANKVFKLSSALNDANSIIEKLEEENQNLKLILSLLDSDKLEVGYEN